MNNLWLILFVSINIIQKWNSCSVPCTYPHPQSFQSVSHLHKWHYHFLICSNQRLQSHPWLFASSYIPHPIHLKFYQLYFQNASWIKWFFTTSIISTQFKSLLSLSQMTSTSSFLPAFTFVLPTINSPLTRQNT